MRIGIAVVPRQAGILIFDVRPRRSLLKVLHDRPHHLLPRDINVGAERLPVLCTWESIVASVLGRQADAQSPKPGIHESPLPSAHDQERVLRILSDDIQD
eukprot:scaffold1044_cov266-Pinguiococcus_pyrenoidosus.AAC.9